jgi:hypothetical protein
MASSLASQLPQRFQRPQVLYADHKPVRADKPVPTEVFSDRMFCMQTTNLWELASQLTQRFSVTAGFVSKPQTCGSWLASDGADAATINNH